MSREQQQNSTQQLRDEANLSASTQQLPFDSIDDMQEKHLKEMPAFKQLHLDADQTTADQNESSREATLDWLGDTLQVIEFMHTFGDKLRESLKFEPNANELGVDADTANAAENSNLNDPNNASILSNAESFRIGLQNRSEKLRKEVLNLGQLLLKSVIRNNFRASVESATGDETSGAEEEAEEEATDAVRSDDATTAEQDDLALIKRLHAFECNELTFSELLRLYFLRCLSHLKRRRAKQEYQNLTFGIDVTSTFMAKLKLFTSLLEVKSFDLLEASVKASMMAYLCDELLTTTNYDMDEEFAGMSVAGGGVNGGSGAASNANNINGAVNGAQINSGEYSNQDGLIVKELEQTIEELNQVKRDLTGK